MTGRAEVAYYRTEDIRDWIRERLLGCFLDQRRAHMMKGGRGPYLASYVLFECCRRLGVSSSSVVSEGTLCLLSSFSRFSVDFFCCFRGRLGLSIVEDTMELDD